MKFLHTLLKSWTSIFLACIVFSSALFPSAIFANDLELSPGVTDVVKSFSAKYCIAISSGQDPEKAAQMAARQMMSGLIFSGVFKEVMSLPKDDMASFVATEIVNECGSDVSISQQELNDYLVALADSGEGQAHSQPQPFKPFGMG